MAIFDNRLEITSPGKLPVGQTIEKMREGYSKVRNEALAMAFSYMHLIERWGTGMLRIAEMIREAGLGDLEIIDGGTELRFNIYRKLNAGQTPKAEQVSGQKTEQGTEQAGEQGRNTEQGIEQVAEQDQTTEQAQEIEFNSSEKKVFDLIENNKYITISEIADKLGWGRSKVTYYIEKLKAKSVIERVGSSQKGYWKNKL